MSPYWEGFLMGGFLWVPLGILAYIKIVALVKDLVP